MRQQDSGVIQRFVNAVTEMAGSTDTLQQRLGSAITYQLVPLREDEFPPELADRFTRLTDSFPDHPDGIPGAALELSDDQARAVIDEVVRLMVDVAMRTWIA